LPLDLHAKRSTPITTGISRCPGQAACRKVELGGPEAINNQRAGEKNSASRQPAPYKHCRPPRPCWSRLRRKRFRQFSAMLRRRSSKPSKPFGRLSRFAELTLDFGLRRNGVYRLCSPRDHGVRHRRAASSPVQRWETFDLLLEALEAGPGDRIFARAARAEESGPRCMAW